MGVWGINYYVRVTGRGFIVKHYVTVGCGVSFPGAGVPFSCEMPLPGAECHCRVWDVTAW